MFYLFCYFLEESKEFIEKIKFELKEKIISVEKIKIKSRI